MACDSVATVRTVPVAKTLRELLQNEVAREAIRAHLVRTTGRNVSRNGDNYSGYDYRWSVRYEAFSGTFRVSGGDPAQVTQIQKAIDAFIPQLTDALLALKIKAALANRFNVTNTEATAAGTVITVEV